MKPSSSTCEPGANVDILVSLHGGTKQRHMYSPKVFNSNLIETYFHCRMSVRESVVMATDLCNYAVKKSVSSPPPSPLCATTTFSTFISDNVMSRAHSCVCRLPGISSGPFLGHGGWNGAKRWNFWSFSVLERSIEIKNHGAQVIKHFTQTLQSDLFLYHIIISLVLFDVLHLD